METTGFEAFLDGYLKAALWSSTDSEDNSLEDAELAEEAKRQMREECQAFYEAFHTVWAGQLAKPGAEDEQAGHDFWLNRNGHGCGFWDGDWNEPAATLLDEGAKKAGGRDLYLGDDGLVYQGCLAL